MFLCEENAPDNWVDNMGISGFVQDVLAASEGWSLLQLRGGGFAYLHSHHGQPAPSYGE